MRKSIIQLWVLLKKNERKTFVIILLVMIINAIIALVGVGAVPAYVGLITSLEKIKGNATMVNWLPFIIDWELRDSIIYGGLVLAGIFLVKTGFEIFTGYIQESYSHKIWYRLSDDLYVRYLEMPYPEHLLRNSAELIRNVKSEVNLLSSHVIMPILNGITQFMILPLILIGLLIVQPLVSITSFSIVLFAVWLYDKAIRNKLKSYGKILQKQRTVQLKALYQGLGGIKELKVFQRMIPFSKHFRNTTRRMSKLMVYNAMAIRVNNPYLEFVSVLGMLIVVFFLIIVNVETDQLAPIISFYGISFFRLKQGFAQVMKSISNLRSYHFVIRPIYADLFGQRDKFMKNKFEEIPDANISMTGAFSFHDKIEIKDVSYTYPNSSQEALSGINLLIRKGESVGFAGSTGAGKTTLADVMLGLLKPTRGQILVDGKNIFIDLSSWNSLIGYIPQHIFLLDDTIRKNVVFGLPDNEVDQEAVWSALEAAQLSEFVQSLPKGLDTITGERGIRLSGGQRQRIGIARALYHRPPVLIMDEATSALDNLTESNFLQAIEYLMVSHTLIIIAHRLSTIRNCDKIVLLENGRIKDMGSFSDLERQHQLFKPL